ncbi:unnamed protein product [Arabidopsis thaliana]|uniref:F-box domain-containing protein n=1 Tax=Arabidopsis thaliana TaxID=3702 RepID=A0A654FI95_ARATH|nr:unnamed protein product [Arabidopsis thaliana]VYS59601.1 unnamed protein product [Arabidopsis thaliana]
MSGMLGLSAVMGKRPKQQVTARPRKCPIEKPEEIPDDLLIDVFSRLPIEDVARCRCLSRVWSSILRRRYFTELFHKMSSTRPRILFTFLYYGKRLFYSMPQDLDPSNHYSPLPYFSISYSPISAHYHMHFPKVLGASAKVCPPILGLICCKSSKTMIFNPSTRESKFISTTKRVGVKSTSFGYDPIDKLFKVLSMYDDYVCRVSTLGTEEVTWRTVECTVPHHPLHSEICMDGVLYYLARRVGDETPKPYMVAAFEVRLERFKFLPMDLRCKHIGCSAVIDYKGKLAVVWLNVERDNQRHIESFELRVLNDVDEVKWSQIIYELPNYWNNLPADIDVSIVGMTSAGEIVLATSHIRHPFYIFYYSTVTLAIVQLRIDFGIEAPEANHCSTMSTFVNHVENVELACGLGLSSIAM